jgi:16S rRNA (cytosine967-C5)-methyltransferase
VEVDGAYVDELLDHARCAEHPVPKDMALLRELCTGVLRWRGRLDWVLAQFLRTDIGGLTPWIRNVLRLGAYQLLFLDRVPDSAAVNECVRLARRYGHAGTAGLVNGVLRAVARQKADLTYPDAEAEPARFLSVFCSHPEWMVERWLERYGFEETKALCAANNRRPTTTIRGNRLRGTRDELIRALGGSGIVAHPHPLVPDFAEVPEPEGLFDTSLFRQGWFQAQDPSAGLAVLLLDPQPGERVLDMCAAPGGKTTHIAEKMRDSGQVVALDIHALRLARVEENAQRLGLHSITVLETDALDYGGEGRFDRVLVDVPCSGLGVLARRADARWSKRDADITPLAELQLALLTRAASCVRPGGVLVYSTCTIEPEENEAVVEEFLETLRGDFELDWPGPILSDLTSARYVRTFPHHHQMDGAFAARLRRSS